MKAQISQLLLVTNGFEGTRPALDYGIWLATLMKLPITLLGVQEPADAHHPVKALLAETERRMDENGLPFHTEVHAGHTEEIASQYTKSGNYLMILGPLGRPPLRRWLMGRSFRHIMAEVLSPVLYVPTARIPMKNVMICIGGIGYGVSVEDLGIRLAKLTMARITFLHVVPPIEFDYPTARIIKENWEHLIDTDTPPGHALRQGLESAESAHLIATAKVRQGHVVHEILDELKEAEYDLVCMGSPYSTHSLRHLYTPNVTAEVAESAPCPILTVRYIDNPRST